MRRPFPALRPLAALAVRRPLAALAVLRPLAMLAVRRPLTAPAVLRPLALLQPLAVLTMLRPLAVLATLCALACAPGARAQTAGAAADSGAEAGASARAAESDQTARAAESGQSARAAESAPIYAPDEAQRARDELAQRMYRDALQSIAEGRRSDASDTLVRLIDMEPLHAGAWMELALVQCGLGRAAEAERLFAAIEQRFNPPQGILELIAEARAGGCNNWQTVSTLNLAFARGIDQNVNQGALNSLFYDGGQAIPLTSDFLPKHDQYTALSGDYVRDLTPNGTAGFAQLQVRRNDTLHQYDSSSLFVGTETPWRFGRWTARGTVMAGFVTLGSQFYQRQGQLQLRIGPPLPLPNKFQFSVMGGVTHLSYLTLSNFNANMVELRGLFTYRSEQDYASLSYGRLNDEALGPRPGGNRHGELASVQWRRRLAGGVTGEVGYTYQTWHGSSAFSPDLIEEVRQQATHVLRAAFTYPLSKTQSLQLELRQVRNRENISIFQYNNRQLQLSWQWQGL
ncbi:tetratricopeptide repeat protein [Pseudoduganella sp. LjRoot289]|uniref:tetratricopeptide repeat protein n=1 Tax=Pseudoduganella sp. LjRoot289 TaxID=3342314 RepID=UPI003ED081DD